MNEIKITIDYDELMLDDQSIKENIENQIIQKVVSTHLAKLDEKFKKKIDEMISKEATNIIKNIRKLPLDKCDIKGVKETITVEDYIVKQFIDSLTDTRVDERGNSDASSYNKKYTLIQYMLQQHIKNGEVKKAIDGQVLAADVEYKNHIKAMVETTLSPIYEKLLLKLKS